ncbi:MAG: DUF4432 family protein [Humibacter sp.]
MSVPLDVRNLDVSNLDVRAECASDAQLAHFSVQSVEDGPARGTRVVTVAPAGGLHARVLVDRGLDLGAAWFAGLPVAWASGVGERRPGHGDAGEGWHDGWAGGLVTTCGLRNVGVPSEGHGRHGRYSDQPADEVVVRRELDDDGGGRVVVEGVIREPVELGRGLVLRRRMTFPLWSGAVEVDDTTVNETVARVQAPLLYHVNVGAPFLDERSVPMTTSGASVRFGPAAGVWPMGRPLQAPDEVHALAVEPDETGWAVCAIDSSRLGLRMSVSWDAAAQSNLFVWQRRTPGTYVTAIEPANCTVSGSAADREAGVAPWLEPGEARRTRVRISVEPLAT